jgi:hypothetical protein
VRRQYKHAPGHAVSLLQCLVAPQLDLAVRQAAAIQLKNLCMREWTPDDPDEDDLTSGSALTAAPAPAAGALVARPPRGIADADKAVVRANLLEAVVQAPPLLRAQLGVVLRVVAEADFPERWPELAPAVGAALSSPEPSRVYGALFVLRFLARKYEYKDGTQRQVLHALVRDTFPSLLRIVQGLLALNSTAPDVAELLKLVLKTLWSATYMDIPPTLLDATEFHAWMSALGAVVELPLPVEAQPEDKDDRAAWPWWKAKKWCVSCARARGAGARTCARTSMLGAQAHGGVSCVAQHTCARATLATAAFACAC